MHCLLGSISWLSMKLMLMFVPISKTSGPVPVGTAAVSFCSASRNDVLKKSKVTPGWVLAYSAATAVNRALSPWARLILANDRSGRITADLRH